MARYITRVRTARPADEVFGYVADLCNFAAWDPGVRRAVQVEGDGPGPEAVYDLTVAGVGYDPTLRYRTVQYEPPGAIRVVATGPLFTSDDHIAVEAVEGATVVTYDADLRLPRPLSLADPLLSVVFRRIGDRAAEGLRQALDGEFVRS